MMSGRGPGMGAGAEFDAIREVVARLGDRASGIGDDASVLQVPRGERLVATVDAAVEGVHFRREWLTPREIGYRAAMGAASDLAAMAAAPLGLLVAVTLPESWRTQLGDVMDGVGDAAALLGTSVIGGNLAGGEHLSISITALGSAYTTLGRDAARPGNRLYVTGRLGGPGAALHAWMSGAEPAPAHRQRFVQPAARIAEARWLASAGATAAIDISDGLAADAGHLAAASGVIAELHLERVPLVDDVTAMDALASGEEYELLVAAPHELDHADFARRFGVSLTAIGTVGAAAPGHVGVRLLDRGERVAAPPGHDHFSP